MSSSSVSSVDSSRRCNVVGLMTIHGNLLEALFGDNCDDVGDGTLFSGSKESRLGPNGLNKSMAVKGSMFVILSLS